MYYNQHVGVQSNISIVTESNNLTGTNPDTLSLENSIYDYMQSNVAPKGNQNYYPPYVIATFLFNHRNFSTDNGTIITKCKLMKYLIRNKMVPIRLSSLYKLCSATTFGQVLPGTSWTEVLQDGKRSYLHPRELNALIVEIQQKSRGGLSYSISELKDEVECCIRSVFSKKNKLHLLPLEISESTLNTYVNVIKCQSIFNLYKSVGNKTESRHVAEWSIRSTLAYTMIVATTHFLPNVQSTKYHPKKRDLCKTSLEFWENAESAYNKMLGNNKDFVELQPVLPNLVTTTDEMTLFATTTLVHNKESLYLSSRPDEIKNEAVSSASRNHYKKTITGDSHCRGVRIVINSTFTAGGLSAPPFVTVYGLSHEEMPGSQIFSIPVKGLTVGGHQDLYSGGVGYVTFVRGSGKSKEMIDENVVVTNDEQARQKEDELTQVISRESQIADIYRRTVYWPFIDNVRDKCYGFDTEENDEIPEGLRCVSWFDGCNSQMRVLTSDENMKIEAKKKSPVVSIVLLVLLSSKLPILVQCLRH